MGRLKVFFLFLIALGGYFLSFPSSANVPNNWECTVKDEDDTPGNPSIFSLRGRVELGFNSSPPRACHDRIKFEAGQTFNIVLNGPISFTYESDGDTNSDGNNMEVNGGAATSVKIDALKLGPDQCVFDLTKIKNSIWKNMTVRVHKAEKAFCVSGDGGHHVANGENGLVIEADAPSVENDNDQDGVPNEEDNCPDVSNGPLTKDIKPEDIQKDSPDGDGVGNVCDNCPDVANSDQADNNGFHDGDHVGDACEPPPCPDGDDDKVCDDGKNPDNCPLIDNPGQQDEDGDGVGNVCDNCPHVSNGPKTPGIEPENIQKDSDTDGVGDVCDTTPTADTDGDGILDDGDGSGVPGDHTCTGGNGTNCDDNCISNSNGPATPGINPADIQKDSDHDGVGDVCDSHVDNDTDGDGIIDVADACPNDSGPADPDPAKNGCPVNTPDTTDSDNDTVPDASDSCPGQAGPVSNQGCPVDVSNNPPPTGNDCIQSAGFATRPFKVVIGCPSAFEGCSLSRGMGEFRGIGLYGMVLISLGIMGTMKRRRSGKS